MNIPPLVELVKRTDGDTVAFFDRPFGDVPRCAANLAALTFARNCKDRVAVAWTYDDQNLPTIHVFVRSAEVAYGRPVDIIAAHAIDLAKAVFSGRVSVTR